MKFFRSLFNENSTVSCMRFMSVMSLATGAIIAVAGLFRLCALDSVAPLVGIFVGAAFSGKVAQKFAEKKEEQK